jgi:hypothetical protein
MRPGGMRQHSARPHPRQECHHAQGWKYPYHNRVSAAASEWSRALTAALNLEIGQTIRPQSDDHDRLDLRRPELSATKNCDLRNRIDDAMTLVFRRQEALQGLITTLPVKSVPDAAVQLVEAFRIVIGLDCHSLSESASQIELEKLHRIIASCLPIVLTVADLDPLTIAEPKLVHIWRGDLCALTAED